MEERQVRTEFEQISYETSLMADALSSNLGKKNLFGNLLIKAKRKVSIFELLI